MGCGNSKVVEEKVIKDNKLPINSDKKNENITIERKNNEQIKKVEEIKIESNEAFNSERCNESEEKFVNLNENNNELINFRLEALNRHNVLRAMHGAKQLILNESLNNLSQNYANKLASENGFYHSNCEWDGTRVGENLAMSTGIISATQMVNLWYDEINNYDFSNPQFSGDSGHFTQVVWKDSSELGIGYAQSSNGSYIYVANYYPPGNFDEMFGENVQNLLS